MLQRTPSMQRYAGHLTDELDDLSARAKILRTEALRLETEKSSILKHLLNVVEGADTVHLSETDRIDLVASAEHTRLVLSAVTVSVLQVRDANQTASLDATSRHVDELERLVDDALASASAADLPLAALHASAEAVSPDAPTGRTDERFQSFALGCTLDDQKALRARLAALLRRAEEAERTIARMPQTERRRRHDDFVFSKARRAAAAGGASAPAPPQPSPAATPHEPPESDGGRTPVLSSPASQAFPLPVSLPPAGAPAASSPPARAEPPPRRQSSSCTPGARLAGGGRAMPPAAAPAAHAAPQLSGRSPYAAASPASRVPRDLGRATPPQPASARPATDPARPLPRTASGSVRDGDEGFRGSAGHLWGARADFGEGGAASSSSRAFSSGRRPDAPASSPVYAGLGGGVSQSPARPPDDANSRLAGPPSEPQWSARSSSLHHGSAGGGSPYSAAASADWGSRGSQQQPPPPQQRQWHDVSSSPASADAPPPQPPAPPPRTPKSFARAFPPPSPTAAANPQLHPQYPQQRQQPQRPSAFDFSPRWQSTQTQPGGPAPQYPSAAAASAPLSGRPSVAYGAGRVAARADGGDSWR